MTERPLTKAEREKILKRDNYTSGMRHYSEARGWYFNESCPYDHKPCDQLQVHHIEPRRVGMDANKTTAQINSPDNLICLFQCEHVGICNSRRILNG